jgi:hypothetical protein
VTSGKPEQASTTGFVQSEVLNCSFKVNSVGVTPSNDFRFRLWINSLSTLYPTFPMSQLGTGTHSSGESSESFQAHCALRAVIVARFSCRGSTGQQIEPAFRAFNRVLSPGSNHAWMPSKDNLPSGEGHCHGHDPEQQVAAERNRPAVPEAPLPWLLAGQALVDQWYSRRLMTLVCRI